MIKGLQLINFKCFGKSNEFTFAQINLLTGVNGRGKSSVFQSLLLVGQSVRKNYDFSKLIINDEFLRLGNYDDVKNSETPRSEDIEIIIKSDGEFFHELLLRYNEDPRNALVASQVDFKVNGQDMAPLLELDQQLRRELYMMFRHMHYVSADRLGPQAYVDKDVIPDYPSLGPCGEGMISILANSDELPSVNEVLYRGKDSKSVVQQTAEWLSYILDGAKIDIKGKDKESSVLYMLLNNRNTPYGYKPPNMGFGYSYVLPLIVTCLIASPGSILIFENPEAHLHPKAQSRLTEFFAKVASCGIQLFIESHSEHILNGLRVSALDPEIKITEKDMSVFYFDNEFGVHSLSIDNRGKIDNWPIGFFDQQEMDIANIFKATQLKK